MTAASTSIVIGGGIAGPVAATALQQAGISATVYEAYPTVSDGIGGDLALAANGMRALGIIGVDDAVRALALANVGSPAGHAGGAFFTGHGILGMVS